MDDKELRELRREILVGFHMQFAENQRIREQSFLKILGFLGVIIIGYSYVFHKTDEFNFIELSFVAIISQVLLLFGAIVILSIAYNFRRDQTVNSKIRTFAKVIGDDNIFPKSYDPRESKSLKNWYSWIPNFLATFFYVFPLVSLFLVASYIIKSYFELSCSIIEWLYLSTIIISIVSFIIVFLAYFSFYNKLKKFISSNQQNITSKSTRPREDAVNVDLL